MNQSAVAVVGLAVLGLTPPVLACPGVVPCVPSACLEMHRAQVRNPIRPGMSLDFTSQNITLLSNLPLTSIGGTATTDGSSLYAWVDPLTQREYAIMGRSNGTAIVDVTNPTQPVYVANVPSIGGVNTLWREPKVYGNYAYIGVDGATHRMQIVDLTQVRNYSGTVLNLNYGTYSAANVTKIHTLAINKDTGFLYLSGTNLNSGAPHIVDVRNPANPVAAGNIPGGTGWDGYSHEAQVVIYNGPDVAHRGKEIIISSNGKTTGTDTLSIIDATNKTAPVRLSSRTYPNARYIHQGWLTEDHRFFFQNDELDEPGVTPRTRTHLWDLADLDNPIYKGYWDNTTTSIDHNLYVKGNYVYQTNYTTGLRILKIGDLVNGSPNQWLTEVAWFDTYPANDGATFNGAWNNYPFLPSGNILVSDIDGGLFVLRANLPSDGPPIGDWLPKNLWHGTALTPEPASAGLLLCTLVALGTRRRR